jgi:ParB family chromosome partitioning protein
MAKRALGKGLGAIFQDVGTSPSSVEPDLAGKIHTIPLEEIEPNPYQPRLTFKKEEVDELSRSIQVQGLLQPIVLRKHRQGYQIIAGERRFRATQKLGLKSISAQVRDNVSDRDMMELSIIENIQRVQLSSVEEAESYQKLIEHCGLTHGDLAEKLSKSRSAITNTLRLLKLDPYVQEQVKLGILSAGHARALLSMPPQKQVAMTKQIIEGKLSVRDAEHITGTEKAPSEERTKSKPASNTQKWDPNLSAFLDQLRYSLGSEVHLKGSSQKGRLEISFHSQEELEQIHQVILQGSKNKE